jgi:hypothetical protein
LPGKALLAGAAPLAGGALLAGAALLAGQFSVASSQFSCQFSVQFAVFKFAVLATSARLKDRNACQVQKPYRPIYSEIRMECHGSTVAHPCVMTRIQSFRDLDVWQLGMDLVDAVLTTTKRLPRVEFDLRRQINRAVISIPSNVAEGWKRKRRRGAYQNHVSIARGRDTTRSVFSQWVPATRRLQGGLGAAASSRANAGTSPRRSGLKTATAN